jgi:choline dehydrogenase-like flavoprotein
MSRAAEQCGPFRHMEIDGRGVRDDSKLEADLCIVGAGPAGLTIARALVGRSIRIVLLESGGRRPDPTVQDLCAGTTSDPTYVDPALTRRRQAGGTAQDWDTAVGGEIGARYLPLDAIDFESRAWVPGSGWPFDRAELDPYYDRAHEVCDLGPISYCPKDWADPECPLLSLDAGRIVNAIYRYGLARTFTDVHLNALCRAENIVVCLYGTVVELVTGPDTSTVTHVRVKCLGGTEFRVSARLFVLAAGGIENARVLLTSTGVCSRGLGNEYDLVGRYFMDHPRDRSCALVPTDRALFDRAGFYDLHTTSGGFVMGRLALSAECLRQEQLLNVSATLRPRPPGHRSAGMRALRILRSTSLRRPFQALRRAGPLTIGLGDVVGYGYRRYLLGYEAVDVDWSGLPDKPRRFETFELLLNLEQAPDPDNRVTLGAGRDALGQPRPHVVWRWRERDQRSLDQVRRILARDLERAGIGRIVPIPGATLDPNAHHHLGTTRMHRDAHQGVVDENCRVHATSNVFVAGSSVFPTGGCANPTLTIVALALRLADHLGRALAG